jgi:uncharacterized membrane protein (DUF4010 family)
VETATFNELAVSLAVALGIGLLIGAERERRKLARAKPATAGIRTFSVAALAGAVSLAAGGPALLAVTAGVLGVFVAVGYWRTRSDGDPGLTTEVALMTTLLAGALAVRSPLLAAMTGVGVAVLLAGRTRLHSFVGSVLTADELEAALVLGAASLVVLPLLPDRTLGPFDAINPRTVWMLVILVLAIGAAGHVAVRALGARFGLAVAGLASGFASSSATIGAMGARAAKAPEMLPAAVAGAVLSTVATIVQLAAVLAAISLPTLQAMALPLACAGAAAVAYGGVFTLRGLRAPEADGADPAPAISLRSALTFGAILAAVLVASAALQRWFGAAGAVAAAGVAGLVDAHAGAISAAALTSSGALQTSDAVLPILAAISTNTVTKTVFALSAGGRDFAWRVVPGLVLVLAAAWAGALPGLLAT